MTAEWWLGDGGESITKKGKRERRVENQPVGDDRRDSGRDRRRFDRVLVDLEVDYRSEETFLFAYITDISAMGIFIRTNFPEPSGTRLNLRFTTPTHARSLELEGIVIWVNPYRPGDPGNLNPGMGVKFLDLAMEQRERLTDFVKTFAYLDDDDAPNAGDSEEDDDVPEPKGHA